MSRRWKNRLLPRPRQLADVRVVHANGSLSQQQIFDLMTDPDAEDLICDLVSPTRMIVSGDWIFKAKLNDRRSDLSKIRARVEAANRQAALLRIWHPARTWFIIKDRTRYLPCNVGPRLVLLSEARGPGALRHWWKLLRLNARVIRYGMVLDPWPSNFGSLAGQRALYYLDDEVYELPDGFRKLTRLLWRELHSEAMKG